jgi:serine kinase of HPr protein (carbohydrate metabolism regulator)
VVALGAIDRGGDPVEIQVHGALVEVLGVGVLLTGHSGVGKSECALELVQRRHRLVADDVVRIRPQAVESGASGEASSYSGEASSDSGEASSNPGEASSPKVLMGWAPELIRHYMEIRGIGLLYIPDLYGPAAVRDETRIELVCHLEPWRDDAEYDRLGLERPMEALAGVEIPALILPVRPARSVATLVEVAVRDYLQRQAGVNAAQRLDARLRGKTLSQMGGRTDAVADGDLRDSEGAEYERVGIERPSEDLAGVQVPSLVLPVRPASSMATLIEAAARDALQRRDGINAARRLDEALRATSKGRGSGEGGS